MAKDTITTISVQFVGNHLNVLDLQGKSFPMVLVVMWRKQAFGKEADYVLVPLFGISNQEVNDIQIGIWILITNPTAIFICSS